MTGIRAGAARLKTCSVCTDTKPTTEYYRNRTKKDGLTTNCKTCEKAYSKCWRIRNPVRRVEQLKAWVAKNPEKHRVHARRAHIKYKYGLSEPEFIDLCERQFWRCAICTTSISKGTSNIDHDHATGKVRGILCANCNRGLGAFQDNYKSLLAAGAYLEKHRRKN